MMNTSREAQVLSDKTSAFGLMTAWASCHILAKEGGRHLTCDDTSASHQGWRKNTWTYCTGVGLSQVRIVAADRSFDRRIE
jgi:hypothetical protein